MNKLLIAILVLCSFNAEAQEDSALAVADSLYAMGNYSKAIEFYRNAENSNLKIAKSYEALGNYASALNYYEKELTTNANTLISKYNYGKLLLKIARYQESDSVFQELQKDVPNNPNFPYHLGLIKEKLQDSTAMLHFARTLKLDSTHQNAIYKFAKRLVEKREFLSASIYIEKGLSADPNSMRFLNLQALTFFYSKDYHRALSAYKKLLTLGQSNRQLHENLAVCFSKTNQFEEAIDQYTLLINQFDDKNPVWHYQIAGSFKALHYYEKARRHYEIAILLKDLSTEAEYWSLSQLFGIQKEYRKQMEALNKVIAQNPQNQYAHYYLATAADNYFKDKKTVIPFYENYLKKFGDNGRFSEFAKQRMKDLKAKLHFNKD